MFNCIFIKKLIIMIDMLVKVKFYVMLFYLFFILFIIGFIEVVILFIDFISILCILLNLK